VYGDGNHLVVVLCHFALGEILLQIIAFGWIGTLAEVVCLVAV